MDPSSNRPFLTAYVGFVALMALLYLGVILANMAIASVGIPGLQCVVFLIYPVGGFFIFRQVVRQHLLSDLQPSAEIPCPHCNTPNRSSAYFCQYCGESMVSTNAKPVVDASPTPSSIPGGNKENSADDFAGKITVYRRYFPAEMPLPISQVVNPDGVSTFLAGEPGEPLSSFECPWCRQSYTIAVSGNNFEIDCIKCNKAMLVTRN